MVRKKSVAAKIRKRKQTYKEKSIFLKTNRTWRILLLIMKAVRIFLSNRRDSAIAARLPPNFGILDPYFVPSNCIGFVNKDIEIMFPGENDSKDHYTDFIVVKDILKKLVSVISRRDHERTRQLKLRKKKKSSIINTYPIVPDIKQTKQSTWFKRKYSQNIAFRNQKRTNAINYFRNKYKINKQFHIKHNIGFKNKYQTNDEFYKKHKYKLQNKYHFNNEFRENRKNQIRNKYHINNDFRDKRKIEIKRKYQTFIDFREKHKLKIKRQVLKKYHSNIAFRELYKARARKAMFNKYHYSKVFQEKHKKKMNEQVLNKYRTNNLKRLKTIDRALNHYRMNYTSTIQMQRRLYNQKRRVLKKYFVKQSHTCQIKHRNIYMQKLKEFRALNRKGPDYVCISCRLALFRNQVIPYIEEKYIKNNMSCIIKKRIHSYVARPLEKEKNWICKYCSDKMKQGKMPSRAIVNKLELKNIPPQLKRLNNLEKHLIALRLPFLKIINLSSGKVCGKFAQKGTKGPLHCVPSNIEETVTTLPRPIDKSMMVRLQLKRRLKYKAVWEDQLINPNDVRNALITLTKIHPDYKNIKINEINENYLTSDKENGKNIHNGQIIEPMIIDENNDPNIIEDPQICNENLLQRLALGEIVRDIDSDEEVNEDDEDIRTKYNIGTDSCTQAADFNDFLFYNNEPCVVAPAENNKLSSLLTDKTIERLAFPHLFPDGQGTYDEERITDLKWKEYCKTRLFSSDSRFASDSSYIFYLQYLGDLKQVFSSVNVAFRKTLPMTVKHVLDEIQMKFLMNKDMIYRYLQSVRGSPQYWLQRLKDLFGMTRQLGFPTFFVTLSCADIRWKEFTDIFARHTGTKVKHTYTFEEKTKLLRANPVLAARLFEKRFTRFMNLFIKGGAWCLGKVKDWYARIEMQFRGSPHAHMPLWVEDAPKYNGLQTNEKTREDIVTFCDKYITTKFPSFEEDSELHNIIKEVQTHSRNHSKSCLKYHKTICRFGFPRPIARRTFICEPIKIDNDDDKRRSKKIKQILTEMNITMNALEKEKMLLWSDFDNLLSKYNWTYEDYEYALRIVHTRALIVHKREPNARWVNQYNEEMLRAWDANMDIQFVLDPYACAKYLMSYTTKPEREMSLLLQETHKECREGNMSVREEMKKLTGTFFNHRQVSVQEAIYRATKMPLTYSSRGVVFVPSHTNSCKFLKPSKILKQMDPEDDNIYMSNLADKYFDRPSDPEFDICMADFASEYEIISTKRKIKNPKTPIKYLNTLNFAIKKRYGRNAIIRYPYFNQEIDKENYFENILSLYLPIRSRNDLKKPYELFYETHEIFDTRQQCMRKVKDIVRENRKKYEAHFKETEEMESLFNHLSVDMKENDWAEIVANKEKNNSWLREIQDENNPDLNLIHTRKNKNTFIDLKQKYVPTNEIRPLLDSMNEEQQEIFYHVRDWCMKRLHNSDTEPLRLFITGGAGTGKSHLLKCLHYEATRIFSRKKHLEPDENIDEIHTLITAFTGAAAVNVGGVTIHSAFGIGTQPNSLSDNLSCDKLNTYRCKLGSLKLLFVDEVSLIQAGLWGAIHSRLTQIMGIHSNTIIFGNVGIIAIGDFYQCSPVASQSIYSSLLWSDHFEYVELKINERQKTNSSFAQMLNRIRKLKKNETMIEDDVKRLEKCHQRYLNKEYNPEALHLFAKNAQVDAHNEKMLDIICTDIRILYELDRNDKEIKINKDHQKGKSSKVLRLAKNARVMITKNICVNDGIANGVIGRIVDFIETENKNVSRIIIKCDLLTVGRIHRINCKYCHGKDTICVIRENDSTDRQDNDFGSKKSTKQFPLRLSWAVTIHKAQGITVNEIVISLKDLFGTGMGYTGFSRVCIENGLFLSDLYLNKIYCNENIDTILSQMKEMKKKKQKFQKSTEFLNILFHNIEGLKCNFNAFRNHHLTHKADLICLAETWLNHNTENNEFQLNGYNLIYKTRSCSFSSNHPLHSQKGGGVAVYFRENLPIKKIDSSKHFNLEYITIELEKSNITVITCYRSPQQSKNEFLINLTEHLKELDIEKNILLIGDFNEDTSQDKSKPIETKLKNLGFTNIFQDLSTTNNLTSLDCAYSNFIFNKDQYADVIGTYYSFHNLLFLSLNMENEQSKLNTEIQCNDEEKMEIDKPTETSLPLVKNFDRSTKRKKILQHETHNKIFKQANPVSGIHDINDVRKEKQIFFLQNFKEIQEKNRIPELSKTLTPNEQLRSIGLKKINVLGDGNCFFRAISHQLYGHENEHSTFRSATINYLLNNINMFAPFIDEQYSTIENYIDEMSKDSTYVDHITITATAVTINKNIIIHELNHKPLFIPGSDFLDHQLHIWHDDGPFPHYQSVVCINDDTPFLSFEHILST